MSSPLAVRMVPLAFSAAPSQIWYTLTLSPDLHCMAGPEGAFALKVIVTVPLFPSLPLFEHVQNNMARMGNNSRGGYFMLVSVLFMQR